MASDGEKALFLSLTSATSLAFLLLGSYRLWALRHEKIKVEPNWLAVVKPVCAPFPSHATRSLSFQR